MKAKFFSVIIPTCHRNDLLAKCLACLAPGKQTLAAENYEVIVTDDGSKSTARDLVKKLYPWAEWIEGPKRGPAANRNCGAKQAAGDWLVFTDDDCLPTPGWLEAYALVAKNNSSQALEGAIEPIGDCTRDMAECPVNTDGGHFWSANIAVERNLFLAIDGFDESFPMAAHEDQDLMLRLKKTTSIPFIREAVVQHPVRTRNFVEAIGLLPARCRAWSIFAYKNRVALGYGNRRGIIACALRTQFKSAIRNLRKLRIRQAALNILTITVGVPIIYRFLRQLPLLGSHFDSRTL
jgi:GT2 family glycosyltransferase